MDPIIIGVLGIVLLLVLLVLGVHIAIALGAVGLIGAIAIAGFRGGAELATVTTFYLITNSAFIVIPLFVFMGVLSGAGGISRDVYSCLSMWTGRFKGSLGVATVLSCTAFGVVTGSSVVCTAVFSKVSAPEMRRQGFDKRLAYGITASAGTIGMLIPPSTLAIIYAILSQASPGKLQIAGIVPGVLLTILFSGTIMVIGMVKPTMVGYSPAAEEEITWKKRFIALRMLWPIFVVAAVMLGGIFFGVFTINEAASFGAFVLMIIIIATGGSERWNIIARGTLETASVSAMIFLIIAGAGIFSRFLIISGITPSVLNLIIGMHLSSIYFIIAVCLLYLVMGCFLDSISMLSITLPLIIPVVNAMGLNPIYFAMVAIMAIQVGLITPPVGLNVFAAKAVAEPDVKMEDVFIGAAPFLIAEVVVLVLLIAIPWLTLVLPNLMLGK